MSAPDLHGGQPTLPAMAVLPDGRFCLRIGMRYSDTVQTWEVRRLATATEGDLVTGWRHDSYMSDEQVWAAGAQAVEALVDVEALAVELEAAGQYTAARMTRNRITRRRHEWVGT